MGGKYISYMQISIHRCRHGGSSVLGQKNPHCAYQLLYNHKRKRCDSRALFIPLFYIKRFYTFFVVDKTHIYISYCLDIYLSYSDTFAKKNPILVYLFSNKTTQNTFLFIRPSFSPRILFIFFIHFRSTVIRYELQDDRATETKVAIKL